MFLVSLSPLCCLLYVPILHREHVNLYYHSNRSHHAQP